ncbi:hypothetical protein EDB81DRAFT_890080 [Dactylonectria macrodidyma]|uniref:Uncharacterized protein n=1 Tax=Dactylonectria macrodidyma TaxID=307937 RepID=A0A9P9DSU4_9HYPO|nr:hypothetical protein EDB81DRAFT_890080 [Dactylonectria macrodidyma]
MSLMSPKNQAIPIQSPSVRPTADHDQDPEVQIEQQVYLASPQKFDEAIGFSFTSTNGVHPHESNAAKEEEGGPDGPDESGEFRSFLEYDQSSSYSNNVSITDPDSPKMTQMFEKAASHAPLPAEN